MGGPTTIKIFSFLFLAIFLVGCVANEQPPIKFESSEPKRPAPKPKYVSLIQPALAPASTNQKKVQRKSFLTADIIGKNQNYLIGVFGKPSFKRFDAPSQLWRYIGKSCLLDLYLYSHKNFQNYKVLTVAFIESRSPNGLPFDNDRCLNIISNKLKVTAAK